MIWEDCILVERNRDLKERTYKFALSCVKLASKLPKTQLGKLVKNQLLKCSTSVASNYRATNLAQSKASFISKLSIVLEESDECEFWLQLIIDTNLLTEKIANPVRREASELTRIFAKSRKTARNQ